MGGDAHQPLSVNLPTLPLPSSWESLLTLPSTPMYAGLDRQGSSAGPRLKTDTSSSSLSSSSKSARPLSPLSPGAQKFTHDAQLALRLAQELNVTPALPGVGFSSAAAAQEAREKRDHQLALALARHTESEANSRAAYEGWRDGGGGEGARDRKTSLAATVRTTASEAESCPCCEARWTDLGQALSGVSLSGSTKSEQEWQLVEVRRKNHVQKCVEEKANLAAQLGDEGETWDGDECGDGAGTQGVVQQGDVTWTGGRKGKDAVVGTPGASPSSVFLPPPGSAYVSFTDLRPSSPCRPHLHPQVTAPQIALVLSRPYLPSVPCQSRDGAHRDSRDGLWLGMRVRSVISFPSFSAPGRNGVFRIC